MTDGFTLCCIRCVGVGAGEWIEGSGSNLMWNVRPGENSWRARWPFSISLIGIRGKNGREKRLIGPVSQEGHGENTNGGWLAFSRYMT